MTESILHRLAKVVRCGSKKSFAVFKKVGPAEIKTGLVAATLFALVYVVETNAILALESSQAPFEVSTAHQNMYR
jgi:hypothetical protein